MDAAASRQIDDRVDLLYRRLLAVEPTGTPSFYRPDRGYHPYEQAGEERDAFGICIADRDGGLHAVGDHDRPFALQSISKVFAYCLALDDWGFDHVSTRVGVEPSGDAFNSIMLDERDQRPPNPMVNAGAIVTSDLVRGKDAAEKVERIVGVMRAFADNDSLGVDQATFDAEWASADRNRAIAYLMRSYGFLTGDVDEALSVYLKQCSVLVTCDDLAMMAATLAHNGVNPRTGVRHLPDLRVRDVLSVMFTCGMYDFAGEWAFDVGVPAKSGVSGGILAAVPGKSGMATFSPGLDPFGNSIRGVQVCEVVSQRLGLHVFAGDEEDTLLGPSAQAV